MILSDYPLPKEVENWVARWLSRNPIPQKARVERLAGDGSTRTFYRISQAESRWVLMHDAGWLASQDYPVHQQFLQKAGLPVPGFFEVDEKSGFLLMEDLGDELAQQRIQRSPEQKLTWLKHAVVTLAHLHGRTFPVPQELPASKRIFDRTKFFEEFQWTLTHLHQGLLKLPKLSVSKLAQLDDFCRWLSSFGPKVFCHRDYHTRNLLIHRDGLYLIDFQDARLGSPHYDLASLLYDAYIPLSDSERTLLSDTYRDTLRSYPALFSVIQWNKFDAELLPIAFQRTVKAAGSFASFFTRFQKKTHLRYLLPALNAAVEIEKNSSEIYSRVGSCLALKECIALVEQLNP